MRPTTWSEPPHQPVGPDDPRNVGGYRILARLGAGGMGRVYLGTTQSGRRVAVKVVRPEFADDPEFRRRFEQEVRAAQRVQSIYTAAVIDADLDDRRPWVVTAHIPAPSLAQAVAEVGPLPPDTVRILVAGVAEALQEIHRADIVHRDLKPSNVLLAPDGPRVIDFGIARATDRTSLTRTGVRIGSPQFMSPEQALGHQAGTASDIFALGSLTYFAATGRTPFGDGPVTSVLYRIVHEEPALDGCPEPLRTLVRACLAKDPAERPALHHVIDSMVGDAQAAAHGWPSPAVNRPAHAQTTSAAPTVPPPFPEPATAFVVPPTPARSAPRSRLPAIVGGVGGAVLLIIGLVIATNVVTDARSGSGNAATAGPPAATSGGASASNATARALAPGTYQVNRQIYRDTTWAVTLTDFQADADTVTAHVTYQNIGAGDAELSCTAVDDPAMNRLVLAGGQVIASTETYCSTHSSRAWTVPAGGSFLSYATFPAPADVRMPFSLEWQPGEGLSGTVTGTRPR